MHFDVGMQRSQREPRQAKVPKARCVVVQDRDLLFDHLIVTRSSQRAMKDLIHANELPKIALPDGLGVSREGGAHRSQLFRRCPLRTKRRAIALDQHAGLEHVLHLAQSEIRYARTDARLTVHQALERKTIERVAHTREA